MTSADDNARRFIHDIYGFKECEQNKVCPVERKIFIAGHNDVKTPPGVDLFVYKAQKGETYMIHLPIIYKIDIKTFGIFTDNFYGSFNYDKELEGTFERADSGGIFSSAKTVNLDLTVKKPIKELLDCKTGLS